MAHNLKSVRFSTEDGFTIGQLDALLRNLMTMGVSDQTPVVLSEYASPHSDDDRDLKDIEFVKNEDSRAEKLVIETR